MRAAIALAAIVAATLISFVCQELGAPSAFFITQDRGANFLKVILQLPGPPWVRDTFGFEPLLRRYSESIEYRGPVGILHLTPLSMLISLAAREAFAFLSPIVLFLALHGGSLAALMIMVRRLTSNALWPIVALISYPVLMAIDRGNLYALS